MVFFLSFCFGPSKSSYGSFCVLLGAAVASLRHVLGLQKDKMDKALESVRKNFNSVRTGRANVAMLDRIMARFGR